MLVAEMAVGMNQVLTHISQCELAGGEWIALQHRNATVAGNRHSKK